jgi:hypothetical protein
VVDDQDAPRVVGVQRVDVVREGRVQHLRHPRQRWVPRSNVDASDHGKNVQDPRRTFAAR